MNWFLFFVVTVIFSPITCKSHHNHHNNNGAGCPQHHASNSYFRVHDTKCYEFAVYQRKDWHSARDYCRNNGGNLVTIQSHQEQTFLNTSLSQLPFHDIGVWIGLNDEGQEGHYKWVSGKTSSFRSWAKGQPDDKAHNNLFTKQDCVLFYIKDVYIDHHMQHRGWHDAACQESALEREEHAWVCEYDTNSHLHNTHSTTKLISSISSTASLNPITSTIPPEPTSKTTKMPIIETTTIPPEPTSKTTRASTVKQTTEPQQLLTETTTIPTFIIGK